MVNGKLPASDLDYFKEALNHQWCIEAVETLIDGSKRVHYRSLWNLNITWDHILALPTGNDVPYPVGTLGMLGFVPFEPLRIIQVKGG